MFLTNSFIQIKISLKALVDPEGHKTDATSFRTRCGICSAERIRELFWATDRNFQTTEERFLIARCLACGVVQTLPQPSTNSILKYYPTEYYPSADLSGYSYKKYIKKYQIDKVNRVSKFCTHGKLLDVGSGVGYFVNEALHYGFEAEGLELSGEAARIGREDFHLKIQQGDLLTIDFPASSFDVITLWQVLEHLHNPDKILEKVNSLLRPGGLIVISLPNFSSFQSKIFRRRWYHLEIPRHLFHYDPPRLAQLLGKNGFETRHVNFFSREHNWAGILGSILHLSPENESLLHKVFRKTIGFYLASVLAWLESVLQKGGTFEVYAVKKEMNFLKGLTE